jgi:beta-phosphoglucomutase family hydrolase
LENHLAFIFDLDGVIVDSTALHTKVWERYLEPFGIDSTGIQERMHGKRNDEIVRALFGDGLDERSVYRHGAAKEALYREMIAPQLESKLVPGIREFLQRFTSVPTGLASNAEPANVECILEQGGLKKYFQVVVDGDQVDRPKPHPDIYLKAAELLGVPPGSCIVFEDSITGVSAALGAGARVIGLSTTCKELPGVDLAVPDFRSLDLDRWLGIQLAYE